MNRRELAFARVTANFLLGGSALYALTALMQIWIRDHEQQGKDRG